MWDLTAYSVAQFWFHRLLGGIYLIAFASLLTQVTGLYGPRGISPIGDFLSKLRSRTSWHRYYLIPSLFWWRADARCLVTVCWIGIAASIAMILNFSPTIMAIVLWLAYLSFVGAGQEFLSYQWDVLLLEAGFAALFLPHPMMVLALWFLLFRLMVMSGLAKFASGDPSWRDLTGLTYHYWTQPLPTPIAWYVHRLPLWLHKASCALTHAVEIAIPFLIFAPWPLPAIAFFALITLQVLILLTGNYCFFNLLTIALCLFLIPDSQFPEPLRIAYEAPWNSPIISILAVALILLGLQHLVGIFYPRLKQRVPFYIVNPYGLFAYMTKERPEVILEASQDGVHWHPYTFRYKPGDPESRPRVNFPHQPRLDWQLWFLALRKFPEPWLLRLVERLLEGEPAVEKLFQKIPFHRPTYVRAQLYEYRFGKADWWERVYQGELLPPIEKPHRGQS